MQKEYTKKIDVLEDFDVFVAGGGPSGTAAAYAAAKQGSRVFLAEGHSCFGGMGTAGLVPSFCEFADGVNFTADGFGRLVHDRMFAMGGNGPDDDVDDPYGNVNIKPEVLKRLYDDLMAEAGVEFSFESQAIDVLMDGDNIDCVICASKGGLFGVRAKVYIDCTGDADLAVRAGADFVKGDGAGQMQPGTLCSMWGGIDWQKTNSFEAKQIRSKIEQAFDEGVFRTLDLHLPGIWRTGEQTGGGNIGHLFELDATDAKSRTKAYIEGRRQMPEFERFFKKYGKGFDRMDLLSTGSLLGVRESRRIKGRYVLSIDDFHKRAVFEDEIGRYNRGIDLHRKSSDTEEYKKFLEEFENMRYGPGESYGIPYRVLLPNGVENLLVAGRAVSTDRQMHSSIRVMPACFITGQAAGIAGSMCAECSCSAEAVNVSLLQKALRDFGAYLPNFKV